MSIEKLLEQAWFHLDEFSDVAQLAELVEGLAVAHVLTAEELARWRARAERVRDGQIGRPPPNPERREWVLQHLRDLASAGPDARHDIGERVRAFVEANVITERDARLIEASDEDPDDPDDGEEQGWLRVEAVSLGPESQAGGLRITHLVRYAAGLRIFFRSTAQPSTGGLLSLEAIRLSDRRGTQYESAGGGISGSHNVTSGHAGFSPAPPPGVTEVTVHFRDDALEVPLA